MCTRTKRLPQRLRQKRVWVSPEEVQVSSGLLQGQGFWVQQTWVWHKPSWRGSPLTPHRASRTYTGLGNRLLEGTNRSLCTPEPRRKEQRQQKRLTQACAGVSRCLQCWHGPVLACCRVGDTECSSAYTGPFEGGTIIFITSTIVWPQVR